MRSYSIFAQPAFFALLAFTTTANAQAPSAPTAPAAPAQSAAPAAITNPVLDSLIHSPQIVGITKQDGVRFLGRVVGGDHGFYIVQTFHFAGPPRVRSRTIGSGRKRRTVRSTADTTIKDETAVRLLVAGVAGSNLRPREIQGARQMFTGQDIRVIQALSPPDLKAPAVPVAANMPPVPPKTAWTLATLWPTADPGRLPQKSRPHHRRKPIP